MKTAMKNNRLGSQKGFSLIELMIVVAIIGILSAIAVPNYQKFQRKSRQSEAKSMAAAIYTTMKSYEAEWGQPSMSFSAIGYQPEGRVVYNCGFAAGSGAQAPRHAAQGAVANVGLSNSREACGTAVAPNCTNGSADFGAASGASPANAVAVALAGNNYTFTIGCEANIGTATMDQWTMNQAKTLANVQDGT